MRPIFELETVLGQCDADRVEGHFGEETGDWTALAFTTATLSGAQSVLKIEQSCYMRSVERPEEIRDQNWVRPEMLVEPVSGSKEEAIKLAERLHQRFIEVARNKLIDDCVLPVPETPSSLVGASS